MDSLCPLIILDHLYVSRVKLYSFFYPLSIMTKRERKCGFFLRFYMLRGEIHAFIRGLVFHLVRGSVYLLIVLGNSFSLLYTSLVTIFIYIVLILYIYIYMMYVFFTYLYMCCFLSIFIRMFLYVHNPYYYFTHDALMSFV